MPDRTYSYETWSLALAQVSMRRADRIVPEDNPSFPCDKCVVVTALSYAKTYQN